MKKLILVFVVGLVAGLAATTGARWYLGRDATSLASELAAATDTTHADSTAVLAESPDSVDSEAAADSTALVDAVLPVADTVPVIANSGASPSIVTESASSLDTTRLAAMFASMQAREAADVLEHMNDDEVQVILGQLGNREAAAILSNLTPERAAIISRAVISGERSNP